MSKTGIIIAVDILPIRPISRNVITLIGDITTDACHAKIRQTLASAQVDVCLCDGAPNVGASYDRDAYNQNEIALLSLKCATAHLKPHGSFVTKIYRSKDYSAFLWVVRQLFHEVKAVKPTSSRAQSAEIFLVCTDYRAPDRLDPKLLDPKCVFEHTDEFNAGGEEGKKEKKVNIFHKNYNDSKRSRQGYDMTSLDASMRNIKSVSEFVESVDPIGMLTDCTSFTFSGGVHDKGYLDAKPTTEEIKTCVSDLKVLNKSDFKSLLTWRLTMQSVRDDIIKKLAGDTNDANMSDDDEDANNASSEDDSDKEESEIQSEIQAVYNRKLREKKRIKKKEREAMAKRRRRAALGMDLNAIDVPDHDQIFNLTTVTNAGDLEAVREVDLDTVNREVLPNEDDVEQSIPTFDRATEQVEDEVNEDTGYSYRLDREMDEAYDTYLRKTKSGLAKLNSKMEKRDKKAKKQKASMEAEEDEEMTNQASNDETKAYVKLLSGTNDSDDSDNDNDDNKKSSKDVDSDDGFDSSPLTPDEHRAMQKAKKKKKDGKEGNPLLHELPDNTPVTVKTARWFSNPLFESIGGAAHSAASKNNSAANHQNENDLSLSEDEDEDMQDVEHMESSDDEDEATRSKKKKKNTKMAGLNAEDVLKSMPKTDKQLRHEKRLKSIEKEERKKAKLEKLAKSRGEGFEVVPGEHSDDEDLDDVQNLANMDAASRKRILDARKLIKAGMGTTPTESKSSGNSFEVVAPSTNNVGLPIIDNRKYDSPNEDYDSDDHARTLALGTMMLRRSRAKTLIDASYNRYAWNDPSDLPDWFIDDEVRNHRPQLPIPPELVQKMKERFLALSTKPIAKVIEARHRKSKRASQKLALAKKKAESVAGNADMSEAMKLKAISKAMRSGGDGKNGAPGKTYVVSKKGGQTKGGKGMKLVDKREKNDKRAMERSGKKRKGKKGGLTGSKRRRNHK